MAIELTTPQLELIRAHGEEAFPHECCGFLFGHKANDDKSVVTVWQAANARLEADQHNRFLITAPMYIVADREARARGAEIIGFYHSHPNAPARPSTYDREHAWAWYSYVIVSVIDGSAEKISSWVLRPDRSEFDTEPINNGKQPKGD